MAYFCSYDRKFRIWVPMSGLPDVVINAVEAAMLAGMLPTPRYYNPYKRPEKARGRQNSNLSAYPILVMMWA